jgi:hypothetical protein
MQAQLKIATLMTLMAATVAVMAAVRKSLLDGVIAGLVVGLIGLGWSGLSRRTINARIGIRLAAMIAVGVLILLGNVAAPHNRNKFFAAAGIAAAVYLLVGVFASLQARLRKKPDSTPKQII